MCRLGSTLVRIQHSQRTHVLLVRVCWLLSYCIAARRIVSCIDSPRLASPRERVSARPARQGQSDKDRALIEKGNYLNSMPKETIEKQAGSLSNFTPMFTSTPTPTSTHYHHYHHHHDYHRLHLHHFRFHVHIRLRLHHLHLHLHLRLHLVHRHNHSPISIHSHSLRNTPSHRIARPVLGTSPKSIRHHTTQSLPALPQTTSHQTPHPVHLWLHLTSPRLIMFDDLQLLFRWFCNPHELLEGGH
jgi:hypothetical protein